jgi:hypothetical protein
LLGKQNILNTDAKVWGGQRLYLDLCIKNEEICIPQKKKEPQGLLLRPKRGGLNRSPTRGHPYVAPVDPLPTAAHIYMTRMMANPFSIHPHIAVSTRIPLPVAVDINIIPAGFDRLHHHLGGRRANLYHNPLGRDSCVEQ